ncbi:MAG: ABC transporter ATP-binding protein [Chloroflexi bacterium]|nr:ABC transporter ATP-binding protein [Chloroflexota bacterium]
MTAKIKAVGVAKAFSSGDRTVTALHDFNLEVQEGEFVCIVGPSGCGKSTFLRILGGLATPTSGQVTLVPGRNGAPLQNIVFQEYAIFPWKTVLDNVAFGLEMRGIGKAERYATASEWLRKVGLSKFADAYPHQLSGGMKQRVSIARAFANDPEILLMDEPLGALDAQTRAVLQEELLRIWEASRKTVVYITHSIEEALLLGDRVVLMTAHPGTFKCEFAVPFKRPRTFELTGTAEFGRLNYAIWKELQGEVLRAMEQQL